MRRLWSLAALVFAATPASAQFAKNPLWVANYQVEIPHIPPIWIDYAFWQYGSDSIPGEPGKFDLDVLNPKFTLADFTL